MVQSCSVVIPGLCGRCIRTKDFWLTPEDFIRLNKPDGTWRKDILSNGIPLGKLIMVKTSVSKKMILSG